MRKYVAEALGTFVLVFGGVGSAVLGGPHIGIVGVSFAFGLSLLAMVYTIGPISGCHINPAVTLGVLLARKMDLKDAAIYVFAQVAGAIVASGLILFIANSTAVGYIAAARGLGANGFGLRSPGGYSMAACFLAEVILTMFLVLTLIHLVGIPITNTSVNPARSIGPAIFVGGWALQQLWLFIVAPLVGAAVAAGFYAGIRLPDTVITTQQGERALASEQAERGKMES